MGDHLSAYSAEERLLILQGEDGGGLRRGAADRNRGSLPNIAGLRESLAASSRSELGQFSTGRAPDEAAGPVLLCSGVLVFTGCFVSFTLAPLFESLRSAVGFSSLQVAFLTVSPLFFMAVLTLPIASLVRASRAWDVMTWTALILALGAWVAACAPFGSPLEYLLLGQLLTGAALSMLVWLPGKLTTCWLAPELVSRAHTVWSCAAMLGFGLPYLVAPFLSGGDGLGRHLGALLMYRAAFVSMAGAFVLMVRTRVEADSGVDEDEVATCRHQDTQQGLVEAAHALSSNRELHHLLVAMAMVLAPAFSLYVLAPFILAHPPSSFTPAEVGMVAWGIFPGGVLGVLGAERLFSPGRTQRFRVALLACAGSTFFWMVVFLMLIGRAGKGALSFSLLALAASAAAFAHVGQHAARERAFPVAPMLSGPMIAGALALALSLTPLITVWLLSGNPVVYATEDASPSGLLMSPAAILWLGLVGGGAGMLLGVVKDDERRAAVDQFPHIIAHVTDRVASDLRDARSFSEAVIPLPPSLAPAWGDSLLHPQR